MNAAARAGIANDAKSITTATKTAARRLNGVHPCLKREFM